MRRRPCERETELNGRRDDGSWANFRLAVVKGIRRVNWERCVHSLIQCFKTGAIMAIHGSTYFSVTTGAVALITYRPNRNVHTVDPLYVGDSVRPSKL